MRRIAVINQKGGVGKTTTSTNLGAALAESGRRVVVVDIDPQANLTLHVDRMTEDEAPTIYGVLTGACTFADAVTPTESPNLSIVPSTIDLSGAETELASVIGRETILSDALQIWEDEHRAEHGEAPADYLIFDCPPSLGLLALNALAAANEVLLTVQTEFLALQGMSKLVEIVQLVKRRLNPDLLITGILPCLYDSRLRLAREVLAEVRGYFPGQVFKNPIKTNVKLAEAPSYGQTILQYAPESKGAQDYRLAAQEVIAQEERDPELQERTFVLTPAVLPSPSPAPAQPEAPSPEVSLPGGSPSGGSIDAPFDAVPAEHDSGRDVEPPAAPPVAELEAVTEERAEPLAPEAENESADGVLIPASRPAANGPPEDHPEDHSAEKENTSEPEQDAELSGAVHEVEAVAVSSPPASVSIPLPAAPRATPLRAPQGETRAPSEPGPPATRPRQSRVLRASDLPPLPADVFDSFADYLRHHS